MVIAKGWWCYRLRTRTDGTCGDRSRTDEAAEGILYDVSPSFMTNRGSGQNR